jgi:hypothetical protein
VVANDYNSRWPTRTKTGKDGFKFIHGSGSFMKEPKPRTQIQVYKDGTQMNEEEISIYEVYYKVDALVETFDRSVFTWADFSAEIGGQWASLSKIGGFFLLFVLYKNLEN